MTLSLSILFLFYKKVGSLIMLGLPIRTPLPKKPPLVQGIAFFFDYFPDIC
jgi:hypothetical protein